MKSLLKTIPAAFVALTAIASPSTPDKVLLERPITANAVSGDRVTFLDQGCRYVGILVRESAESKSVMATTVNKSGMDTGKWSVSITQRACDQIVEAVHFQIDLPRPPSLVGGGGIPPVPTGYQAGASFVVRAR